MFPTPSVLADFLERAAKIMIFLLTPNFLWEKINRKCQPLPFVTTFDSVRKEREGITGKERRRLNTLVVEGVGDGGHNPQFLDVGGVLLCVFRKSTQ